MNLDQVVSVIDSVAKVRERFDKVKDALGHGSDPHTGKSWWGRGNTRTGKAAGPEVGPHPSRKEAAEAAFSKYPNAHSVSTGHGNFGGHFDIQWHNKTLEKAKDAGGHGSEVHGGVFEIRKHPDQRPRGKNWFLHHVPSGKPVPDLGFTTRKEAGQFADDHMQPNHPGWKSAQPTGDAARIWLKARNINLGIKS